MAKVIVERPRFGSRIKGKPKGLRRRQQRLGHEGMPRREGMKRRCNGNSKSLNEHLGPLRRYLLSQVGRPWDKVFADICQHINRNSAVQDHVRDHVDDYVIVHALLVDGVPCRGKPWGYGTPIHEWAYRGFPLYVCPKTGILRRTKDRTRKTGNTRIKQSPQHVKVDATRQCRFIDGAWYMVTLRPLDPIIRSNHGWDIILNRPASQISPSQAAKTYGAEVYAIAKRRLSKREMRQYPIPIDQQM
jgi:hypothetical protein